MGYGQGVPVHLWKDKSQSEVMGRDPVVQEGKRVDLRTEGVGVDY